MSNRVHRAFRKPARFYRRAFLVSGCQLCGRRIGRHSRFDADYTRLCPACYRSAFASFVGQGAEL